MPGETAGIWRYKFWKLIVEIPTTPWKFKIDPETKPSQKERIIFQAPFFLLGLKTRKLQLRVCISKVFFPSFLDLLMDFGSFWIVSEASVHGKQSVDRFTE